ncbi:hypothetical protein QE152_g734 [Popillia japonica]|uniref:Uncharacterized protein n=1 Tax=Popillia japonica TaxID=7064 RepID=A0AAW1NJH3_POPJA
MNWKRCSLTSIVRVHNPANHRIVNELEKMFAHITVVTNRLPASLSSPIKNRGLVSVEGRETTPRPMKNRGLVSVEGRETTPRPMNARRRGILEGNTTNTVRGCWWSARKSLWSAFGER